MASSDNQKQDAPMPAATAAEGVSFVSVSGYYRGIEIPDGCRVVCDADGTPLVDANGAIIVDRVRG